MVEGMAVVVVVTHRYGELVSKTCYYTYPEWLRIMLIRHPHIPLSSLYSFIRRGERVILQNERGLESDCSFREVGDA